MIVELVDAEDKVISAAPVYSVQLEAPGQEQQREEMRCPVMIRALVPNVDRGSTLLIRRGEKILWHRQAPDVPVSIRAVTARVEEGDRLIIEWEAEVAGEEPSRASVRWSRDEGQTWHAMVVGLPDKSATLDLSSVPGGEVVFEVRVDDGFDSAVAVSDLVSVPHKPPVVAILSPQNGVNVVAGGTLRLWGAATDENGERLPDDACQWLLDGEPILTGLDVFVATPSQGEHQATLRATDPFGQTENTHTFAVSEASGEQG
jgi:hypothetical protein